jgi:hypothetical protein
MWIAADAAAAVRAAKPGRKLETETAAQAAAFVSGPALAIASLPVQDMPATRARGSMPDDQRDEDEAPRSVLEEAEAAKASSKAERPNRTRQIVTGAAIGIGSAALVAALLYANRVRKDKGPS